MVWYSHLVKNFPQFTVIHIVKGFTVVSEAEVDISLEFSCFFYDPTNVGNLISGSSTFSKSSLNIWKFLVHTLLKYSFSRVQLFATPWTVAHQAPLSMGFSRQEYWSGLPCPPPGDLPNTGIKPTSLTFPALAGRFFTTTTWEAKSTQLIGKIILGI